MNTIRVKAALAMLACALLFVGVVPALAYGEDEFKGMIIGRTADTMTVRADNSEQVTVLLSDDTKVQVPKGVFKARHEGMSMANLIPGLRVKVKGTQTAKGQFNADTVEFSKDDLRTANMISAGLAPTQKAVATNVENIEANKQQIGVAQEQISANQLAVEKRFDDLTDFEVKENKIIYFESGKADIAPKYQQELTQLAHDAAGIKGYLIEVKGFADSTGAAAANQALSRDRAENVIAFLQQSGNIPLRRIVAPGAFGEVAPVASNEKPTGRAENRRVEVKLLVNRGLNQ